MRQTKRSMRRKSIRKSEKRRLKKTHRAYRKSPQKGGFQYGISSIISANEGIVIYPSILLNTYDSITKIYYREKYYDAEINKYKIFNSIDPEHRYHCNVYSHGKLIPSHYNSDDNNKLMNELNKNGKKIDIEYAYIDMEYAGETIGSQNTKKNDPNLRKAILKFFIEVLQLQDNKGYYLVHGDPHPGNICYKIDNNGNYIIKYIDITQLELVPINHIIISPPRPPASSLEDYLYNSNINFQFSSIIGTIRHVSNEIADELSTITRIGRQYGDVLNDVLLVLDTSYRNLP